MLYVVAYDEDIVMKWMEEERKMIEDKKCECAIYKFLGRIRKQTKFRDLTIYFKQTDLYSVLYV
jgi:hypothetical protein